MTTPNVMLEAALQYQRSGYSIIPVKPDKSPLLPQWKIWQTTQPSISDINKWWGANPNANIGLITGKVSGLVVVDLDSQEGITNLQTTLGVDDLINYTRAAHTGKGIHLYFLYPESVKAIPNAIRILPGVDVKGDSGYVIVPPSVHANGKPYRWVSNVEIKPLPEIIINLLRTDTEHKPIDWNESISAGTRDQELTRRVGKLIGARVPVAEVYAFISNWNQTHCSPPLPDEQVQKIVDSIARRDAAKQAEIKEVAVPTGTTTVTPSKTFSVLSFTETLDRYGHMEQSWIIDQWLPRATAGLIVSPPGGYKTWMLLALAYAVATGKPFLKLYPTKRTGPVLIVQQEDPFPLLFSRLASIIEIGQETEEGDIHIVPAPPENLPIYWHPDRMLDFADHRGVDAFYESIRKLRPELVTIDPLYSAVETDDYMAKSAQQMLVLKSIRDELGTSFMIAHHRKKGSLANDREAIWGSQFLNAWLETGWQMSIVQTHTIQINRHFKMCGEIPELRITFDIGAHHFTPAISAAEKEMPILDAVKRIINTQKTTSQRDILKVLEGQKISAGLATINRALKELKVEKRGGYYVIVEPELAL